MDVSETDDFYVEYKAEGQGHLAAQLDENASGSTRKARKKQRFFAPHSADKQNNAQWNQVPQGINVRLFNRFWNT